jgi:MFS family permease
MTGSEGPPRNRRWLVGVLAAQAVSWTGTRVSAIALPWFVLTTTGSAVETGIVAFVEMAPYVVFQVLVGPVIDRVGPRRVSIIGDLISMTVMAAVPLLYAVHELQLALLWPLVAIVGASRGPADAAKAVFVPAATEAARMPLERGIGVSGSIDRLASTIGPAGAGLVVAAVGAPYALAITAAMFGLGAAIIAATVPSGGTPAGGRQHDAGYLARLRAGAVFLRQERLLRSIAGMLAVTNLLDAACFAVLLPVWARDTGNGPAAIGLLAAAMGACAALSSLLSAATAHRLPRRPVYLFGFLIAGAPRFVVLALDVPLWQAVAVYAVSGLGAGFLNPILGAVMFERAPRAMFGRVKTLFSAIASSGLPFGGLLGGALVAVVGLAPALLAFGALYFVATTLPGLQKEWRDMDRSRAATPTA